MMSRKPKTLKRQERNRRFSETKGTTAVMARKAPPPEFPRRRLKSTAEVILAGSPTQQRANHVAPARHRHRKTPPKRKSLRSMLAPAAKPRQPQRWALRDLKLLAGNLIRTPTMRELLRKEVAVRGTAAWTVGGEVPTHGYASRRREEPLRLLRIRRERTTAMVEEEAAPRMRPLEGRNSRLLHPWRRWHCTENRGRLRRMMLIGPMLARTTQGGQRGARRRGRVVLRSRTHREPLCVDSDWPTDTWQPTAYSELRKRHHGATTLPGFLALRRRPSLLCFRPRHSHHHRSLCTWQAVRPPPRCRPQATIPTSLRSANLAPGCRSRQRGGLVLLRPIRLWRMRGAAEYSGPVATTAGRRKARPRIQEKLSF